MVGCYVWQISRVLWRIQSWQKPGGRATWVTKGSSASVTLVSSIVRSGGSKPLESVVSDFEEDEVHAV